MPVCGGLTVLRRITFKKSGLYWGELCSIDAVIFQVMVVHPSGTTLRRSFMKPILSAAAAALTVAIAASFAAPSPDAPAPATAVAAPARMEATLFKNVRILKSAGGELSAVCHVLVRGNRIEKISDQPIPLENPDKILAIDGTGKTLMPGLIDNHVHLFMAANSQAELMHPLATFEKLEAKAVEEAGRILMRGFTSVRDVGGPVFGIKRLIDSGKAPGPRIYPSGAMISQTSGHGDFRTPQDRSRRFGGTMTAGELMGVGFIADGRDEVLTATRENLRAGACQIKVMAGGGAASAYDPLDVTQYTLDEMKAAVEAADDWGTYVTVHAYTPKAVRRSIEAGVKCIEHGQLLDEDSMRLLAEHDVWLSLQTLEEAPATAPPDTRAKKHTVVQGTDNAFKWARKHHVKIAWGTDLMFIPAQMKNQNTDIPKLLQWFTSGEALKMVTHDNAALLALSGPRNPYPGKLGVVEEGALADLILVQGNPVAVLNLVADPDKNFLVIMKDGVIHKDQLK
ncbi:MAG: Prolidase [Verrucomicrobiales bacterium]|nr:Prolidase [Verrucomicrobiales bacterium]